MAQSMDTIQRRNGATRTALKARANDVMDDLTELRRDVSKLADAAGKAARYEVKGVRKNVSELGGAVRARANEGAGYVREQVRERPGAALGITLGAGMLLGLLLSRR